MVARNDRQGGVLGNLYLPGAGRQDRLGTKQWMKIILLKILSFENSLHFPIQHTIQHRVVGYNLEDILSHIPSPLYPTNPFYPSIQRRELLRLLIELNLSADFATQSLKN